MNHSPGSYWMMQERPTLHLSGLGAVYFARTDKDAFTNDVMLMWEQMRVWWTVFGIWSLSPCLAQPHCSTQAPWGTVLSSGPAGLHIPPRPLLSPRLTWMSFLLLIYPGRAGVRAKGVAPYLPFWKHFVYLFLDYAIHFNIEKYVVNTEWNSLFILKWEIKNHLQPDHQETSAVNISQTFGLSGHIHTFTYIF